MSWVVEKALRPVSIPGLPANEPEWAIVSGYVNASGARAEVRQLRAHYARKGYLLRCREEV